MSRAFYLLAIIYGLVLILAGCGLDIDAGSQLAGQECRDGRDCADAMVCVERRCRPVLPALADSDAGIPDVDDGEVDVDTDNGDDKEIADAE